MNQTNRLATCALLLALGATLCAPRAHSQELLADLNLNISGPDGTLVYVTIRYYEQGQAARTENRQVVVRTGSEPEPLEFGYTGIRIWVAVPTAQEVTVELRSGEAPLTSVRSNGVERIELSSGNVAEADTTFEPPRFLLSDDERRVALEFLRALAAEQEPASAEDESEQAPAGLLKPLVFKSPVAKVDWQTLEAFCEAHGEFLGGSTPENNQLDGWLSWEGSLGARVLSGPWRFERGTARFKLMVADEKLVDVVPQSPLVPNAWFNGPSDQADYIAAAERLAKLMFTGQAAAARNLFAPRFRDTVTENVLANVCDQLRQKLGSRITKVVFVRSELGPYDAENGLRKLLVFHALELETGRRCLSEVDFVFRCDATTIGRGELESFYAREAFQSAHRELVDRIQQALSELSVGKWSAGTSRSTPSGAPADRWFSGTLAVIDRERLESSAGEFQAAFGAIDNTINWDLWRSTQVAVANVDVASAPDRIHMQSRGPVQFASGPAEVQIESVDDRLLGITVLGADRAYSTMNMIKNAEQAEQLGRAFWSDLLAGRYAQAHGHLAADFQRQTPLDAFQQLIVASDFGGQANSDATLETAIRPGAVRISERLDRGLPVMLATYHVLPFRDGSTETARCEFRLASTGEYELLNFESNVRATFPVQQSALPQTLVAALNAPGIEPLLELMPSELRQRVSPIVLAAFLKRLQDAGGPLSAPEHWRLMHDYADGRLRERLQCNLQREPADASNVVAVTAAPLSATFEEGKLISFSIDEPSLSAFINEIDDAGFFEAAVTKWCQSWLAGADGRTLLGELVPELRTDDVATRLRDLRERFNADFGAFTEVSVAAIKLPSSETPVAENNAAAAGLAAADNTARIDLQIQFEQGIANIQFDYRLDAFSGLISAIRPQ